MTCKHERYKQGHHLVSSEALKAMKVGKVIWMSATIKECEDCGADLSSHKVVQIKTPLEYMKEHNLSMRLKR